MYRGWKGLALVAACWCLYTPARAQYSTYPSAVGAARMPEPIPCGPTPPAPPPPNLVPGPVSPQAAPMGPPSDLSLPYDHSSAFQCEEYVQDCGFYVHGGAMALERNKLGAGDIAVFNATAQGATINPMAPNVFLPPPAGTGSALNFNSISPAMSLGIRGTAGYQFSGSQAVELQAFYIWQDNTTAVGARPQGLDTLFYNPPLTFVGDGMFRLADQVSAIYGSSLLSTEANYRKWNAGIGGLELLVGVRYLRQNDQLDIVSMGTALGTNALGLPSPGVNQATYEVLTHNNIGVGQIGAEYTLPVCKWMSFSTEGKAGWGANYLTSDVSLNRGDGLTAFNTQRHATNFAQVYQMAAYTDFYLLDRLRLRLGFTALWLTGLASAQDQVDFNLMGFQARQAARSQVFSSDGVRGIDNAQQSIPHGHPNNNGSMLYWGPLAELQFFF